MSSEILEKLRKILAKTEEAGCTQAEASAAMATANRLMSEHNLSMEDIRIQGDASAPEEWESGDVLFTKKWCLEQSLAWSTCREFWFVEGFFSCGYDPLGHRSRKLVFFGLKENVEAATWVFNALLGAYNRLWREYKAKTGANAGDRRIFIVGVAKGFQEKTRDERRAMEAERDLVTGKASGSTALALVSVQSRTEAAHKERHPFAFTQSGKRKEGSSNIAAARGSHSVLEDGIRAGRSLNLTRGDLGAAAHKKLGS